jgi:hypothetical protein
LYDHEKREQLLEATEAYVDVDGMEDALVERLVNDEDFDNDDVLAGVLGIHANRVNRVGRRLGEALVELRDTLITDGEGLNQQGVVRYLSDILELADPREVLDWAPGTRYQFLRSRLVKGQSPFVLRGIRREGIRERPSLENIFSEYEEDIQRSYPGHVRSFKEALDTLGRALWGEEEGKRNWGAPEEEGWSLVYNGAGEIVGLSVGEPILFFEHASSSGGIEGYGVSAAFATICLVRLMEAREPGSTQVNTDD